jgi:4-carboxymuconolactone decarboxylase
MHRLTWMLMAALGGASASACQRDRLPPIPVEKYSDQQRQAIRALAADGSKPVPVQVLADRGSPVSGPFVPLMRSPELMLAAKNMGDYLRLKGVLAPRIKELTILVVSREWTQQVEWQLHHPLALQAGIRRDAVEAIADGRRPASLTDDEQAAYDASMEILRYKRMSNQTYQRAVAAFGEQGVVELLALNGYYMLLSAVMNGARTTPSGPIAEPLRPFPD